MGMVVGSLKTERAARSLGPSVGWPLVLHGGYATRSEFSLCGDNDSARETARCALLSAAPVMPVPRPCVWALPTVSSAGGGGTPGAPWFLARGSYLRPGPTALHRYRGQPRAERVERIKAGDRRPIEVGKGRPKEGVEKVVRVGLARRISKQGRRAAVGDEPSAVAVGGLEGLHKRWASAVTRDMAVLGRAASRWQTALNCSNDDIKDYFNHLAVATSELSKV